MYKIILFSLFFINCYADEIASSEKLKTELFKITQASHRPITYKQANNILFTKLDNHNGSVCSVYSASTCIVTNIVPSPKVMNIEHTWPQSEGANGDAKSDLHHIFPVDSSVNSIRSSLPFCEVVTVKWENGQSKRGISIFNEHCFEPPADHKGDVARALFYFSVRYRQPIDQNQEYFLRKWHLEDPIDQKEIDRNQSIKEFQNNSNPFIDNPELVSKIIDF
jgi:hypothetical protein